MRFAGTTSVANNVTGYLRRILSPQLERLFRRRGVVKFFLHIGIFVSAYLGAFLVRFEFFIPAEFESLIRVTLPVVLVSKLLAFAVLRLDRGWWRYVSIRDVLPITVGVTLGSVVFAASTLVLIPHLRVPRSVYLIDWGSRSS